MMRTHRQAEPPHTPGELLGRNEAEVEEETRRGRGAKTDSCLSDLLKANLSRFAQVVRGNVDLAQIGDGPERTIEWLLGSIGNERMAGLFTFDPARRVVNVGGCRARELGIDRKSFSNSLRKLARVRRGRERAMILCLLGDQFASTDPEWLLPRLQDHLGPRDLLIFDCLLWPSSAAEAGPRTSHPDDVPECDPLCVREENLEPGQCEFRLEVVPRETRWGVVYEIKKNICVRDRSDSPTNACDIKGRSGRLLNIGSTYRYSGYQLERYLQEHGMYISNLAMCEEHDHALVAARPE